ncbi:hypothetical protein BJ878DRAFT_540458 [Calycina marina]|uniref:Uncharacterized protein n=1 Tax=Calycina marina TaxID=1763456 RepID=A0A9P7Z601_9HELO|nr:hypothetical protein BJ878DRAFT_540458 [Calycina marina]
MYRCAVQVWYAPFTDDVDEFPADPNFDFGFDFNTGAVAVDPTGPSFDLDLTFDIAAVNPVFDAGFVVGLKAGMGQPMLCFVSGGAYSTPAPPILHSQTNSSSPNNSAQPSVLARSSPTQYPHSSSITPSPALKPGYRVPSKHCIPRAINSFMLYRKAYLKLAKQEFELKNCNKAMKLIAQSWALETP